MTLEYRCSNCGTLLQTTNADPLDKEIARLQVAKTAALKVADERTKENCELRQLLRDARDHVPWDVLKRIDAALGASRAEQEGNKS